VGVIGSTTYNHVTLSKIFGGFRMLREIRNTERCVSGCFKEFGKVVDGKKMCYSESNCSGFSDPTPKSSDNGVLCDITEERKVETREEIEAEKKRPNMEKIAEEIEIFDRKVFETKKNLSRKYIEAR
jgi:hypothetical protein